MSCTYIRMRYCSVLGVLVISTKRRTYKFTYLVGAGVQGTPGTEYTCYVYPKRPTERRSTVYQTDRPTDRLNFPFGLHPYPETKEGFSPLAVLCCVCIWLAAGGGRSVPLHR